MTALTPPFREQGCALCREHWIGRSDQPVLLGQVGPTRFYRCEACGAYWRLGFDYPSVVDAGTALAALGEGVSGGEGGRGDRG